MVAVQSRDEVARVHNSYLSFFDNAWFFQRQGRVSGKRMEVIAKEASMKDVEAKDNSVTHIVDTLRSTKSTAAVQRKEYPAEILKPALGLQSVKSDPVEMRRVFQKFDENTDDRICAKDLRQFMGRLGFQMSEEEATAMLASVDHNGDGSVDFDEFFSLYMSLVGEHQTEDEDETLLEAFQVFDKNSDGFIAAKELQAVLLDLGMPEGKSLKNCERMISSVDADGNGFIDINEFKKMMTTLCF